MSDTGKETCIIMALLAKRNKIRIVTYKKQKKTSIFLRRFDISNYSEGIVLLEKSLIKKLNI